jgi:density-regulated protein DRP1
VVIERATRNKRKCVTTVIGLDQFGVKLADASKKFGKKFACGASVTKDASNKEQIDVQARAACVCSCAFAASLALLQAGRLHG